MFFGDVVHGLLGRALTLDVVDDAHTLPTEGRELVTSRSGRVNEEPGLVSVRIGFRAHRDQEEGEEIHHHRPWSLDLR